MEFSKKYLEKLGIKEPKSDFISLKRFNDGAQYRFEVPGIQNPKSMKSLLEEAQKNEIIIHRVSQTKGIMLLTDKEIKEMISIAKKHETELFLSIGPRASYDTSATAKTKEGSKIGYRLRGYYNLVFAIEEVLRAIELGVRGILLYDEGLLYVLNNMRKDGEIPKNIKFKISAHMGYANPASIKLLEENGANSVNPVRDLQLNMIAAIRSAVDLPLDIHTENPKSSGGFIRHYEVPDFIKLASPVYLKTGGSIALNHNYETSQIEAIARIKQVRLVKAMITKYYPDAIASSKGSNDLAIPL